MWCPLWGERGMQAWGLPYTQAKRLCNVTLSLKATSPWDIPPVRATSQCWRCRGHGAMVMLAV